MTGLSNMLRRGTPSLDAEREAFEKNQMISIQKAMNTIECAAKEKHIRNTLMGTHREKAARIFWQEARRLPINDQPITAWKFCHVLHKVMRDGHPNALRDSIKYKKNIEELAKHWKLNSYGYGIIISLYLNALSARMDFHQKYESVPGTLQITEEILEAICGSDINAYFALCVDILECIETQLQLQHRVFTTLDMSRAVSLTGVGQCRLAPLITVIHDTSQLYDCSIKILFKLHGCLPADVLSGHRERFTKCHNGLRKFYHICSNLEYFKRLLNIPSVPDKVPDFFIKSDGSHELGPIQMVEDDGADNESERTPSPDITIGQLVDTSAVDEIFNMSSAMEVQQQAPPQQQPAPDDRDLIIERLKAEIQRLKTEIEIMQSEHSEEVWKLLERIHSLEDELKNSRQMSEDANEELEQMRREVSDAQKQLENAVKAQSLLHNVEKKATSSAELYQKVKDKYLKLGNTHAELLRKNAESAKQTEMVQQRNCDMEEEARQLRDEIDRLKREAEEREKESAEREAARRREIRKIINAAVHKSQELIERTVASLDEEGSESRKCNAGVFIDVCHRTIDTVAHLEQAIQRYHNDQESSEEVVTSLAAFGRWISSSIENGWGTKNMASHLNTDLEQLCRACGDNSLQFLGQLAATDDDDQDAMTSADASDLRHHLDVMRKAAEELLPRASDMNDDDESLKDLVECEMAATSKAVEEAAAKIEKLLNEARERDEGVHLEVNEKILDSCTDLMNRIRVLIASSKELQREIVDTGRGASSPKDFYMKNSRWTEGLISAAKTVGWGATMLTNAADEVTSGSGKFEELVVCSNEISASTAQLVAASRVKAWKGSGKLEKLERASRDVNDCTGKVVAITNDGRRQLDDKQDNDMLANIVNTQSLTQIKRKEMDSQVRVLELQKMVEDENVKLRALRKQHYALEEENEKQQQQEQAALEQQQQQTNGTPQDGSREDENKLSKPTPAPKPHLLSKPTPS